MNFDTVAIARNLLISSSKCPKMYALTRESFINRITTILECAGINFEPIEFYKKHLGTKGNTYIDPSGEIENEWAHQVVDDAMFMLYKGTHEEIKKIFETNGNND